MYCQVTHSQEETMLQVNTRITLSETFPIELGLENYTIKSDWYNYK